MRAQPCPWCDLPTAKQLTEASKLATVNYYICDLCGHVWTTDKQTGAIVKNITLVTEMKRPSN